jgi:hypothetical protein
MRIRERRVYRIFEETRRYDAYGLFNFSLSCGYVVIMNLMMHLQNNQSSWLGSLTRRAREKFKLTLRIWKRHLSTIATYACFVLAVSFLFFPLAFLLLSASLLFRQGLGLQDDTMYFGSTI